MFMQDNKFYIGANYWGSKSSINMWSEWDAASVEEDFQKLASIGVKTLRMFIVWDVFQPLKPILKNMGVYEYRTPDEKPFPDTEAGRAGVSEEACEHFEEFCRLADRYEMKLIVGLLTGHMSFRYYCPAPFIEKNPLTDPTVIRWELKLVSYFVKRFKDQQSIVAWDLGNECSELGPVTPDEAFVWMKLITSAIREADPTRPVVSGFAASDPSRTKPFNIRDTAEVVDITTTHPYQIFSPTQIDPINTLRPELDPSVRASVCESLGEKPAFIEEVGSIGYTNNSEKTEADFLKTMLWSSFAQGNHGCFWWCAFDQGQFDYPPYDWNNYGSDYGFFRADGSPKPIASVASEFDKFLKTFEYAELPRRRTNAVCLVLRENTNLMKLYTNTFALAKQANIELSFVHADDPLPDSSLYIMPSVTSNQPIFLHRFNTILEKVKNGASLYLSLGGTLFRRIPELTGLTISSREAGRSETVTLGENEFRLGSSFRYNIEAVADSCTPLAFGEDGRPIFVKNAYGKGFIYFLALPLELILADRAGIFKDETCAPYYKFYEQFAKDAGDRALKSLDPYILTTEHDVGEGKRLIIAINYSSKAKKFDHELKNGWKISRTLRGGEVIEPHDAAIIELEK